VANEEVLVTLDGACYSEVQMGRPILSRIAASLAFALVCVATFDVTSALVIERGHSPWLALVVGLLAVPISPVAWHVASKAKGWPRLRNRTLACAALAFAAMIGLARTHVWNAVHDHLLWFLPDHSVWFASDPSALGSRASCEAMATMDLKCDPDRAFMIYSNQVQLCEVFAMARERSKVKLTMTIDIAQRCALDNSACDDYEACISRGGHAQ